ncbi:multiple epidermal growth factor-like domains protein 6 [Patiria miniata]|uniref:Uncharacterized protein n=1 Tax=Patiria miniata TaxID=46514 RepID=A0A914AT89_PATMI|nr:multiple epidermal growth factor-like domains protein 6 [Patiria miniata]
MEECVMMRQEIASAHQDSVDQTASQVSSLPGLPVCQAGCRSECVMCATMEECVMMRQEIASAHHDSVDQTASQVLACGRHKFGWYCEYECGANNLIQSCTGSQFGLPDPYGNSCISGYNGTDCDTECPAGTFGAECTQSCHCQSGACNGFTGECLGASGCSTGWSGTNCQSKQLE